jgi:regulatory protein
VTWSSRSSLGPTRPWPRSTASSRRSRLPEALAGEAVDHGDDGAGALALAYRFIDRRERTVAEVTARLERAELSSDAIGAAVAELVELGYLDDARYARVFAEDKRNLEEWGSDRIARTLAERGIDRDLIAAVTASCGDADPGGGELDRAKAILARRFAQPPTDPRDHQRALGLLVRKGYDSDVAYQAVRAWAGRDWD